MATNSSTQHSSMAFLDLVNGNMVVPTIHMVTAHVRNLHQFRAGVVHGKELLAATLAHLTMQEHQIDNMLAFWEPILQDFEAQAGPNADRSTKN